MRNSPSHNQVLSGDKTSPSWPRANYAGIHSVRPRVGMRRFCLGVREFRPISIAFFVFSLGQRPREWQLWAAELIESQFSCLICLASIAVGMRSSPGSPRSRYFSTAAPSLLPGSRTCRLSRLEGYSPRLAEYSLKSDDRWTSAVGDGYPRAPTFKRLIGIIVGSAI